MICSVEGCGRAIRCRALCKTHYERWRRFGHPTIGGKTPTGIARGFLERAIAWEDRGECLIWPYCRSSNGYAQVQDAGRKRVASRVVCETVHGPAPSARHQAAHNCGNGHLGCVNPHHLEWKSPRENVGDRDRHGTTARGERSGVSKLSADEVAKIRELRGTKSQKAIGQMFGVSESAVCHIHAGRCWRTPAYIRLKGQHMKRTVIAAQGEITIFRIDGEMPTGLVAHTEKDRLGRPIISHSESGNHHILADAVDVLEKPDSPDGMRILYALLEKPTALIQDAPDAHGSHMLAPGLVEFRIAREFDPFAEQTRRVAD